MTSTVAIRGDSGALATVDPGQYPALAADAGIDELTAVLEENIGGGLSLRDLQRVPISGGGSTTWEIVDRLTGDLEKVDEIYGTLTFWQTARVYWVPAEDNRLTGEPPDCTSVDGRTPQPGGFYAPGGAEAHRNPGGTCATCPLSKFGTSARGSKKAPACAERRLLFVTRPGELLPLFISAPPTSLDSVRSFMAALALRHRRHYSAFELGFRLTRVEKDGNKWGMIIPTLRGILEGALPRVDGWAVSGSPAARALEFSRGFEQLLGEQGIIDMTTSQATEPGSGFDDGLGGDFADHGDEGP